MGSNSWIVDNLNSALTTWNDKQTEIWQLLTQSPESFRGGGIWQIMVNIHGALLAIGYGLLVLFFAAGVVKTCGSFAEVKTHYRTLHKKAHLSVSAKECACVWYHFFVCWRRESLLHGSLFILCIGGRG